MRGVRQRAKEQRNVNGSRAGDAKAGKTSFFFFLNQIRKKEKKKIKRVPKEERNVMGSKKSQNKAK